MAILKRLKTETAADHKRLESYPYFAAVADEQSGIAGAVDAICAWLTDPGRFSEE